MKRLALLAALAPAASFAQWDLPTILSDNPSDQTLPKFKTTLDGGCYVSWYDASSGGYHVRIQKFDKDGNAQFPANGFQVNLSTLSSIGDHDLAVDNLGNAYVAYLDTRFGTTTTVTVSKITPAGSIAWDKNVSMGSGAAQPRVCVLNDFTIAAGYTANNTFTIKRYSQAGLDLIPTVTVSETGRGMSLTDIEPGEGSTVIGMWVRGTGTNLVTSNKYLYAQKYDMSTATGLWTGTASGTWASGVPVIIFNTNSIQNGTFPPIVPDGNGGFVTAWYETGGLRNAYLEHVRTDGSKKFGSVNTSNVTSSLSIVESTPGRMQIGAHVSYDKWSGNYLVAAPEAQISPQSNYSNIVQKISPAGSRLWPSAGPKNGITVQPIGSQTAFVSTQFSGDGAIVASMLYSGAFPTSIIAANVAPDGTVDYSSEEIYGNGTTKARLNTERDQSGDLLAVWNDNGDLYGTRYTGPDGVGKTITGTISAGNYITAPMDINWIVEITDGSTTERRMVNVDNTSTFRVRTSFSGPVTVTIDGSHWIRRRFNSVGITVGSVIMQNGDADGSGEVDAADIDQVIADFGGTRYSVTYNINSDLDGSGEVDAADIDITIANFGAADE
ncbi:MAG: hypothetical protein JNK63_11300 [Chthonomonas sp.]|nr:hypothetical protein [Chthonomonas sp.]